MTRQDPRFAALLLNVAALAMAALLAWVLAGQGHRRAAANHSDSTVKLMAIDAQPDGTPANTATSFGSLETCVETTTGGAVDIDVVIDAVPEDRPLSAFQFNFLYDPDIVHVTGLDMNLLLAGGDAYRPVDFLTQDVPDSDGSFTPAVADFSPDTETGPGVLTRITLTAVNDGISTLQIENLPHGSPVIGDDRAEEIPVEELAGARVAVGESCAVAEQTPLPNVVAFAPQATPAAGGPASPVPSASPSSGTPTDGTPEGDTVRTPLAATPDSDASATDGDTGAGDGDTGAGDGDTAAGDDDTAAGSADTSGDGGGSNTLYWIGGGIVAAVIVLGGGGFLVARRMGRRVR